MQEIAKHFTQFKQLADKGEYCFDDSQTSHLLAGIMFMRKTRFADDMPKSADELFSGTFKDKWYDYFIGRISDFEVQDSCPKGVIAFVYFFGTTMYVCPLALTSSFTALDRASVFMHEARHIDGYPHVTCQRGPRAGIRGACDAKISDTGSYAVTVETYAQISKYAGDLHPALRAYARSSAIVYADEAFQQEVKINRTRAFLALTNDKKFHVIDVQKNSLQELGSSPELGHVIPRAAHMLIVPDDRTKEAKYVFARDEGDTEQTAGDYAVEYNNSTPAERATLLDMHSSAQWSARVYNNRVKFACDPGAETYGEVALSELPASLVYPDGYDRSMKSVYLIMDSGKVMEIGCDTSKNPYVKPSNLVLDQKYKRIHKVGGDVVGLTNDGKLYKLNGMSSTPLQTAIDGRVHDLLPYQHIEFLDAN